MTYIKYYLNAFCSYNLIDNRCSNVYLITSDNMHFRAPKVFFLFFVSLSGFKNHKQMRKILCTYFVLFEREKVNAYGFPELFTFSGVKFALAKQFCFRNNLLLLLFLFLELFVHSLSFIRPLCRLFTFDFFYIRLNKPNLNTFASLFVVLLLFF